MHATALTLLLLLAAPITALAQSVNAAALVTLRAFAAAGTEPIVAESPRTATTDRTVAAIVPLTTQTAAILIAGQAQPGTFEVVARSKPFALSRDSNFGSWIEVFRYHPPDRIELSISSRSGCARSLATHRFVLRNGIWLVAGLDTSVMRCSDQSVEQDWTESANYLTGKAVRTSFAGSKPAKTTHVHATRRPFLLSAFPPSGPEAAYADMQR